MCTRMACNQLCGNYENCVLNYTSLEEDPGTELKILDCLSALIRLSREGVEPLRTFECRERELTDKNPHPIGEIKKDSKCFESARAVSDLTEHPKDKRNYDYAVNLEPLIGASSWLLFSLTTGLWKKGGFHETAFEPEKYIRYWKEMLVEIPASLEKTNSVWYVVVPSTEERFFDETAPLGITSMEMLLQSIADENSQGVFKPIAVFNSTPRKGEARHELRRLSAERHFPQTKIYPQLQDLLREVR